MDTFAREAAALKNQSVGHATATATRGKGPDKNVEAQNRNSRRGLRGLQPRRRERGDRHAYTPKRGRLVFLYCLLVFTLHRPAGSHCRFIQPPGQSRTSVWRTRNRGNAPNFRPCRIQRNPEGRRPLRASSHQLPPIDKMLIVQTLSTSTASSLI